MNTPEPVRLLTPAEVATLFSVTVNTVRRWDSQGKLSSVRTPGNHRRYSEAEVAAYLRGETPGGAQ